MEIIDKTTEGTRWFEPEDDVEVEWHAWVQRLPAHQRAVAERFTPWRLYRLTATGALAAPVSFGELTEKGRVRIVVNAYVQDNTLAASRRGGQFVSLVEPDDLEPWPPGESYFLDVDAALGRIAAFVRASVS